MKTNEQILADKQKLEMDIRNLLMKFEEKHNYINLSGIATDNIIYRVGSNQEIIKGREVIIKLKL